MTTECALLVEVNLVQFERYNITAHNQRIREEESNTRAAVNTINTQQFGVKTKMAVWRPPSTHGCVVRHNL